ncbi:response regulator transcription factor [Raoultibacter phocaeensis]|uniref:response regulator transcription factor n=1 Tax=Raoultibacter phocaeensis TaxID=2479841 RepID=UPI001118821E|nr:helix-turn-helix transcriptional regulator [Raoultibacter phocaeensis]
MGYLRDIARSLRARDAVFFGGYALYLVFSYMVFHSATVLSSTGSLGYGFEVMFSMGAMGARIVVYLVCALVAYRLKPISGAAAALMTIGVAIVAFVATAMVFQFAPVSTPDLFAPWLLLGGILLGVADALITLLWARFSSTLTLRAVYLFVVLCNAVSLVFYFAITLVPAPAALPIAALLFVMSAAFAKKSLDARPSVESEFSKPVFGGAVKSLWHPVLGTVILCFMSGLMLQISGQHEIPLSSFQQTSLFTSAIAVLCLLLPALLIKKPLNVGKIYAVALPLSAAGFLLLPLIWNAAGGIVNSFAQLGAMVAGIILWCMIADSAHDTKLPSALLFSLALACTNAAQLAGTIIGFVNAETLKQGDLVLTTVALVSVYLLLMAALLLFKDKRLTTTEETGPAAPQPTPEEVLSSRCNDIAAAHQFTPRETEIFKLLAQGYTMPVISEKLFVSENTVKSHVKSIYQKLGIHVRSELIELVNRP